MESLEKVLGFLVSMLSVPANTGHTNRATNAAATVTLVPGEGKAFGISSLSWSYSGTPTGGSISIFDGGNLVEQWDITAGGPGFLPVFLRGSTGQTLAVTLSAGGSGIVGKINVNAMQV